MKNLLQIGAVTAALALGASASAATFDFYALNAGAGYINTALPSNPFDYAIGSQTVAATAVLLPDTSTPSGTLFAKGTATTAATERGLGLTGDPDGDNEIYNPHGIRLDTSANVTDIRLGSVQSGESWQILGCNATCTVIANGIGTGTSSATLDYNNAAALAGYSAYVIDVPCAANIASCLGLGKTDKENDIVLMSIQTADVPEPGVLGLFGLGALVIALRRRHA